MILQPGKELEPATQAEAAPSPGLPDEEDCSRGAPYPQVRSAEGSLR